MSIAGPLTAPKVTAPLTVDRADINLPDSLPPNVVVLKVVETNSKAGKQPPPAPADQPPALPATLDIKIDMPGNIFVRGHGLDSEWRGQLTITGTSAAPAIAGSLEQIRGSVDLLGKTFTLTRGSDHLRRQRQSSTRSSTSSPRRAPPTSRRKSTSAVLPRRRRSR